MTEGGTHPHILPSVAHDSYPSPQASMSFSLYPISHIPSPQNLFSPIHPATSFLNVPKFSPYTFHLLPLTPTSCLSLSCFLPQSFLLTLGPTPHFFQMLPSQYQFPPNPSFPSLHPSHLPHLWHLPSSPSQPPFPAVPSPQHCGPLPHLPAFSDPPSLISKTPSSSPPSSLPEHISSMCFTKMLLFLSP